MHLFEKQWSEIQYSTWIHMDGFIALKSSLLCGGFLCSSKTISSVLMLLFWRRLEAGAFRELVTMTPRLSFSAEFRIQHFDYIERGIYSHHRLCCIYWHCFAHSTSVYHSQLLFQTNSSPWWSSSSEMTSELCIPGEISEFFFNKGDHTTVVIHLLKYI